MKSDLHSQGLSFAKLVSLKFFKFLAIGAHSHDRDAKGAVYKVNPHTDLTSIPSTMNTLRVFFLILMGDIVDVMASTGPHHRTVFL